MENMDTINELATGLGILAPVLVLIIRRKIELRSSVIAFIGCILITIILGISKSLDVNVGVGILLFTACIAMEYYQKILPRVNEWTVLSLTLILGAFSLINVDHELIYTILNGCISLPTLIVSGITITAYAAFTKHNLPSNLTKFIYVWFICLIIPILIIQMQNIAEGNTADPITNFILGYSLFYLITYGMTLFQAIPLPGKHQTIEQRLEECNSYLNGLLTNYSNYQIKRIYAVATIVIIPLFFYMNNALEIVDPKALVGFLIIATDAVTRHQNKDSIQN